MNKINLLGYIKNIRHSHDIDDVIYDKADIVIPRADGKEDIVNIRFKRYSNPYAEDQLINITGNIRSYSAKSEEGKNRVSIYVFTYFDKPTEEEDGTQEANDFVVDGRICKIDPLRTTTNGRTNIHFILANNLLVSNGGRKLNAYLPCIAWGSVAKKLSVLKVSDKIVIYGRIHSREYVHQNDNGEAEIKVAHELLVTNFEVVNEV